MVYHLNLEMSSIKHNCLKVQMSLRNIRGRRSSRSNHHHRMNVVSVQREARSFYSWRKSPQYPFYRGADKFLARPTSRCTRILFVGENISFDASLVIYINSTNIPPIMVINSIYETQNLLSL